MEHDYPAKTCPTLYNATTLPTLSHIFLISRDIKKMIEIDTLRRREKEWNKKTTKLDEIKRTILAFSRQHS